MALENIQPRDNSYWSSVDREKSKKPSKKIMYLKK